MQQTHMKKGTTCPMRETFTNKQKSYTKKKTNKLKCFYAIFVGSECLRITKFQSKLNSTLCFCMAGGSFSAKNIPAIITILTVNVASHCCIRNAIGVNALLSIFNSMLI